MIDQGAAERICLRFGLARPSRVARLHSLPADSYGPLGSPPGTSLLLASGSTSWREYLADRWETAILRYRKTLGYPASWEDTARVWFGAALPRISDRVPAVFLHGDFHFDNLKFVRSREGPRISGLLDLEWAWGGDAAFDLLHLEEAFSLHPDYAAPFLESYGLHRLPEDRLRVYRLLRSVEILAIGAGWKPEPRWDLIARHEVFVRNLIEDLPPFRARTL